MKTKLITIISNNINNDINDKVFSFEFFKNFS